MLNRRELIVAGIGLGLGLTACGSEDETDAPSGTDAGFPARVQHKFGTTVVEQAPQRVATYGGGDVDTLLALGAVPLLVPDIDPRWKAQGGVAPWSRDRLNGTKPVVASNQELQFERVASVRPDLITAVEYDMKRADYDKLTELAPTVPPPAGFAPYTVPWDTMALQVGAGLGRRQEAEKLVAEARAQIAKAAKDNPRFAGSKVMLVDPTRTAASTSSPRTTSARASSATWGSRCRPRSRSCSASSSTRRSAPSGSTCWTPPTR